MRIRKLALLETDLKVQEDNILFSSIAVMNEAVTRNDYLDLEIPPHFRGPVHFTYIVTHTYKETLMFTLPVNGQKIFILSGDN